MNVLTIAPSSSPAATLGRYSATGPDPCSAPAPTVTAGRGVLDGAFAVLDALAHADEGLGLTALARVSGLAKASAHRLAGQLVTLGAVQCVERRYETAAGRHVAHRAALAAGSAATAVRAGAGPQPCRAVARHGVAADPA